MCLITPSLKFVTATEDITVYKVVLPCRGEKNIYLSSIWNFRYKLNKLYRVGCKKIIARSKESIKIEGQFRVYVGLHSYVDLEEANFRARLTFEIVVRCTIPKGSKYLTGTCADRNSIVSNQIIINEVIKSYVFGL